MYSLIKRQVIFYLFLSNKLFYIIYLTYVNNLFWLDCQIMF